MSEVTSTTMTEQAAVVAATSLVAWQGGGPQGGYISALAMDPSTPQTPTRGRPAAS